MASAKSRAKAKARALRKSKKGIPKSASTWEPKDEIEKEVAASITRNCLAIEEMENHSVQYRCRMKTCNYRNLKQKDAFMPHFVKDHERHFLISKNDLLHKKETALQKAAEGVTQAAKNEEQAKTERKIHFRWATDTYGKAEEVAENCFQEPGPWPDQYGCKKPGCKNVFAAPKDKWLEHFKIRHKHIFEEMLEKVKNRWSVEDLCEEYTSKLELENSVNTVENNEDDDGDNAGEDGNESAGRNMGIVYNGVGVVVGVEKEKNPKPSAFNSVTVILP